MKWIVAVILLACIATSLSVDIDLSAPWEHYKKVFKKNYSQEEEDRRHSIWESNVVTILLHNLDHYFELETFSMGLNEYSDMTHEEFLTAMNDLSKDSDLEPANSFEPPSDFEIPPTVNWLDDGYVTEVEDQGLCGGSWAHSATGALEGQHKKKTGNLVPLSKQNLIDCIAPSEDNSDGCNSRGSVHKAFEYVKNNGGINTKKCYPSEQVRGNCEFNASCIGTTCTGYENVESGNEEHLQSAVAYVGPISVNIDASSSKFQFFRCGTFQDSSCSSTELNHAALLIGYGHNYGHDYWLLKNSWGTKWGCRGGLFKIPRNKNNHCGIATQALYPVQSY